MPEKKNPLNLNPLQLKTLTLLQALARIDGHHTAPAEDGSIRVGNLPRPHGNHFHMGDAVVASADATGLSNPAVWLALERKGLIRSPDVDGGVITAAGLGYDTGLAEKLLHRADH
ncbi:MAG: hypothetical protein P4M00_17455 [Azospirillaceae bacterium]|nr:hypothetical protein [Azospirillaceae bacterium]